MPQTPPLSLAVEPQTGIRRWIRLQDIVWLLLIGGVAWASPGREAFELVMLTILAVFQLAEPRIPSLGTGGGAMAAVALKLLIGFLLIGWTGGIGSSYYLILLLPVVSAATALGLMGTMIVTLMACGCYLIFVLPVFLDPMIYEITTEGARELIFRAIFLPVVAFVIYQLTESQRIEARRHQVVAEQLTIANQNLHAAEAAMRRSERLAALGQMSAGLAHELRNPLGTVKASAEMLAKNVPQGLPAELAGFISSEVDRVNSLITRFLDFARPLKMQASPNDLSDVLDRAVAQLERLTPPLSVKIYKNYSPDIPKFPFDAELLERVAYNLLLNAAQASPPDAVVTIKTRMLNHHVEFAVIDRGSGIDTLHRESIFNPFFTTKKEGVGLGLAVCAKIVDEHHGTISVESEPGVGSVFRVLLPVAPLEKVESVMKKRILVVEDEEKLRRVIQLQLASCGYEVEQAGSAEAAIPMLDRADLVLSDLKLPGMSGLELLPIAHRQNGWLPFVLMTAFGTVETAVEAMKTGAVDFILKPFSLDHLAKVVEKALEVSSLRDENRKLKEELGHRYQFDNIVGRSPLMQDIFATIMRVAPTRATVLLAGESGVGKDLIARAIHYHSPRRDRPFVKINCTAIPENLMESELFGYERGAFTGANVSKPGKFEQADTGTAFLDEIGDVPANIQVKLLRVLQEREFERLGSNKTLRIDVRVVAATNVDLRAALEQGTFREDLYYRLNVVPMNIPSLRERKEDIPFLARHFVDKLSGEVGSQVESISDAAIERLMEYHWPGNVREIENVIERSLVLCSGKVLGPEDIRMDTVPRPRATGSSPATSFVLPEGMSLDQYEQAVIREALRSANGNKSQAARLLGLTRNALRYRLSQMGMDGS